MKKAFTLVLLVVAMSFANSAPFGLTWGMHHRDVANVVGGFYPQEGGDNFFYTCKVSTMPKNHSDADFYMLVFTAKDSLLVKVVMYSVDIKEDPYGSKGYELFNKISQQLRTKYGFVKEVKAMGLALYNENDEVYQCLKYPGCGSYVELLQKDGTDVVLSLEGVERGEGFIKIGFESELFSKRIDQRKEQLNKANTEAF